MFRVEKRALDREALAAAARALGVRVLEHESCGEIILDQSIVLPIRYSTDAPSM